MPFRDPSTRRRLTPAAAAAAMIDPARSPASTVTVSKNPVLKGAKPSDLSPAASTVARRRSEEHTSELQSLMRISYAVFCLKKKNHTKAHRSITTVPTDENRDIKKNRTT